MDAMVPDSAATAFSMYSGMKSKTLTMGYDANIKVSHCVLPISVQVDHRMLNLYQTRNKAGKMILFFWLNTSSDGMEVKQWSNNYIVYVPLLDSVHTYFLSQLFAMFNIPSSTLPSH